MARFLEEARSGLEMQKAYFKVNKELENDAICDKLADQILRKEPNNLAALNGTPSNISIRLTASMLQR
ncbi:MAG: hypothetical protein U5L09_22700 [Bacteroidales bacterium]|nr:hypothetical protein [Bacteroidales bacterium]